MKKKSKYLIIFIRHAGMTVRGLACTQLPQELSAVTIKRFYSYSYKKRPHCLGPPNPPPPPHAAPPRLSGTAAATPPARPHARTAWAPPFQSLPESPLFLSHKPPPALLVQPVRRLRSAPPFRSPPTQPLPIPPCLLRHPSLLSCIDTPAVLTSDRVRRGRRPLRLPER